MALHLVKDEPEVVDVETALRQYEAIDAEIKHLTQRRETLKAQIMGAMAFTSRKRIEVPSWTDGRRYRATYTVPSRLKVDAEGIEKALGARRFARVSDRVLNPERLMEAVEKGRIAEDTVKPFITRVAGSPQVRFYLVNEEEDKDEGPAEDR